MVFWNFFVEKGESKILIKKKEKGESKTLVIRFLAVKSANSGL
jgi:hypothetical protein